jgi:hypothetical protein
MVRGHRAGGCLSRWHNQASPFDVNANGVVSQLDALLTIDALRRAGPGRLATGSYSAPEEGGYMDISGDGYLSPLDGLLIVSRLRSKPSSAASLISSSFVERPGDLSQADEPARRDEALLALLSELERERSMLASLRKPAQDESPFRDGRFPLP